jgi:acyl phosphate:glycerol-3-phosphate acyltransferase
MFWAALVLGAYLLGSVCFGLVYARMHEVDLRGIGSGNVGATNVGRTFGRGAAWFVMGLDLAKGLGPILIGRSVGAPPEVLVATGVASVVGHVFPIWFGFRGGKGAATAAGVLLGAAPAAGLAACLTFMVLKRLSHRASVGSLGGAAAGLVAAGARYGESPELLLAAALFVLVTLCHHENIRRLVRGEEPTA